MRKYYPEGNDKAYTKSTKADRSPKCDQNVIRKMNMASLLNKYIMCKSN